MCKKKKRLFCINQKGILLCEFIASQTSVLWIQTQPYLSVNIGLFVIILELLFFIILITSTLC